MRFNFTFLLLVITNVIFAQTRLTGKITNAAGTPLAYTNITLLHLSNQKSLSSQADSAGAFSFKSIAHGQYVITASFTGYETTTTRFDFARDTVLRIVLSSSTTQLSGVNVTSNKPNLESNAEKTVYNVANSVTATGTDALTAVGQLPGVKVSNGEISIAGKGAVKVMVNNTIVQLSGTDLTRYLKSISSNQVSKIELIKNPGASFEADGNAGIINIVTKKSKKQGYSGNIQISDKQWLHKLTSDYGNRNYYLANASANLNYNSENWSVYTSVSADKDHELEGFETDVFYPKQAWLQTDTGDYKYSNINAIAGADYKLSKKTTIGITYLGGKNIYDGADYVNNPVYNASGTLDSTLRTYATYHPVAISNSINLHTIFNFDSTGKRLVLNADYYNYYRTDRSNFESNSYLPDGGLKPAGNTRYHDTNKQQFNIYTFKADAEIPTTFAKYAFGGKLSFINNYSNVFYFNRTGIDSLTYNPQLSNEFDYTENTQSAYVSASKEQDKWKYQMGVRAELTQTKGYSYTLQQTTKNNYLKLFPSLLLTCQANEGNSFSLTYGRRINRPTFWNLNPYKSFYTAYSYLEGNPYLQPEYNHNVEVSHTLKNNLTSALFFSMTSNGFNNAIIASADTNLVHTIPLNFIKTYRYGISESVAIKASDWWENNNQVTFYYTNARSVIASFKGVDGLGMYMASNNTVYLNKEKTFAAAVNGWYQFAEVDHIGKAKAYSKLDIGFTALALKKSLNISLLLSDAFRSSASSVTTISNGLTQRFTNFQINRFVQLSVGYRFGSKQSNTTHETGNAEERKRS